MYLKRTVLLSNSVEENKLLLIVEKSEKVVARVKGGGKNLNMWAVFKFGCAPLVLMKMEKEGEEFCCELSAYTNVNDEICGAVFSTPKISSIFYGGTDRKEEFFASVNESFEEFVRQIEYQNSIEENNRAENLFESDDEEVESQINEAITNELVYECLSKCDEDKCKECIYKKAFFERESKSDEPTFLFNEEKVEEKRDKTFYFSVKNSIDELFASYPEDSELMEKIEGSKFAKVDYEGNGNFYSVGIIYDEKGEEKYICYAIYGKKDVPPPSELSEFSQYLPMDDENGYYLMYQCVEDGKSVVMD